jgi:hypothetical protein
MGTKKRTEKIITRVGAAPPFPDDCSYRMVQQFDRVVPSSVPGKWQAPPNWQVQNLRPQIAKNHGNCIRDFEVVSGELTSE